MQSPAVQTRLVRKALASLEGKYARAEVPDGFLPIAGAVLWTPFRE